MPPAKPDPETVSMTYSFLQFGCGNMGGAMLTGWLASGIAPAAFTVVDPHLPQAPAGVRLLRTAPTGEAPPRFVLLGFKPQGLAAATPAIAPLVWAGHDRAVDPGRGGHGHLARALPNAAAVVRVMPNLAAALGKSPIALVGDGDATINAEVTHLMAPLGTAEWLSGEDQMDLVTALAGSGPAFIYRVIDALAAGATDLGLPREQADRLALAMVDGAAALAAASEHGPGELARRVASPGGTTQRGSTCSMPTIAWPA
jgi:pyrroline-5-carboxylate reductase